MYDYTATDYFFDRPARRTFRAGGYYTLYLPLRGTATLHCGDARLPCDAETILLSKPEETAVLVYPGGHTPFEMVRVRVSPQAMRQLSDAGVDLEAAFNVVPYRQAAVRADSELYMLIKSLARKLADLPGEQSAFGAALYEEGMLKMFLVLVLRACIRAERGRPAAGRGRLMLDEVFLYIQAHITEGLTVKQLAAAFYVSREHLEREFKRRTGQTLHRYIVRAKLDRSRKLLEQGRPAAEACRAGGFASYNSFFRAFKKEYGAPPTRYARAPARGA